MKKWFGWFGLLCVVAIILLAIGSSEGASSHNEGALEEAIAQRNDATSEWVSYSSEVEELEEDMHNISIRLEAVERLGANTDTAKQLRQEKSRIQASLDLATYKMEQASATMDHYSAVVEELESNQETSGGGSGSLTVFGIIVGLAAVCCLIAGFGALAAQKDEE